MVTCGQWSELNPSVWPVAVTSPRVSELLLLIVSPETVLVGATLAGIGDATRPWKTKRVIVPIVPSQCNPARVLVHAHVYEPVVSVQVPLADPLQTVDDIVMHSLVFWHVAGEPWSE